MQGMAENIQMYGDEIMVEFPTPSLAFKAASEIQKKLQSFNNRREIPLEVGIGINFGEAIVGAIGSGAQYDWTMIGHTVNVARRLCAAAEKGEIVAVGEGKNLDSGQKQPMSVKVGDIVMFRKYSPDEIKLDRQDYLVIKEEDILAILG